LGAIGQEWRLMGVGNFSSLGETDMMLCNVNNGEFEVCDISNNLITNVPFIGTVGLNWQFSARTVRGAAPHHNAKTGNI
jgi:hypothetical protein